VEMWIASRPVDQPRHWSGVWTTTDVKRSIWALMEGRDPLHALLRQLRQGLAPGKALDHGCGFGRVGVYLTAQGWEVVGVDFAYAGLAQARSEARDLSVVNADIEALPIRDEAFDCAVSIGVVEHLRGGPGRSLDELRRVLKVGGRALITVPQDNLWRRATRFVGEQSRHRHDYTVVRVVGASPPRTVPPGFYQFSFTKREFETFLSSSGFRVLHFAPYSISHGIAETALGAAAKAKLRGRFGAPSGDSVPRRAGQEGSVGGRLFRYLRSVYDESRDTLGSEIYCQGLGPLFGHMMAFVVLKR
jgi:SAM-dependent methyltransferase